ncbi:MAG: STAS domain-containing protein [Acidimicrobiia bacterium]
MTHPVVHIEVEDEPGVRNCIFSGALDVFSASIVGARALAGLPADAKELVLQLRDLEFMDSAGISALVRLRDQARARGAEVHAQLGRAPHINQTVVAVIRRVLVVDDLADEDVELDPDPAALAATSGG